jgi:hypothetical protein
MLNQIVFNVRVKILWQRGVYYAFDKNIIRRLQSVVNVFKLYFV